MIDWDSVNTVLLDMDGTLLDLRFDNYFWLEHVPQKYAAQNDISADQARAKLFPRMQELRGQLDWYCTTFWSKELDLPIIELKREISHLIGLREYTKEFLNFLRVSGKEVILFTNAHEDTLALKMEKTGIVSLFDRTITSHSLGYAKEIPEAWQVLGEHLLYDPQSTLFIDDSFSVLDAAQEHGITHLFGITQPDSQGERQAHKRYTLLESFQQLMLA